MKIVNLMIPGYMLFASSFSSLQASASPLVANLVSASGHAIKGKFEFKETPEGVLVTGSVQGLGPNGKNGIHIHENAQNEPCKGDFTAVGGHFNPAGKSHGSPDKPAESHHGDLGNLTSDQKGHGVLSITRPGLKLTGPQGIKGRALIIHAKADDFTTQPTGAAGDRIACAIIQ